MPAARHTNVTPARPETASGNRGFAVGSRFDSGDFPASLEAGQPDWRGAAAASLPVSAISLFHVFLVEIKNFRVFPSRSLSVDRVRARAGRAAAQSGLEAQDRDQLLVARGDRGGLQKSLLLDRGEGERIRERVHEGDVVDLAEQVRA